MSIRSTKKFAAAAAVAAASLAAASADAGLITFTYTGFASGTFGISNTAFTNAAFTITGVGLTELRGSGGIYGGYYIQHGSTSISIAGFNTASSNTTLYTEADGKGGIMLAQGSPTGTFVLACNGPSGVPWDMLTSVPTYSTPYGMGNNMSIATTSGTLTFTSFSGTGSFGAAVAPAPGAIALLGFAGLAKRRRR